MLKMAAFVLLLSTTSLILSGVIIGVHGSEEEKRLFDYLFTENNYRKDVRPVKCVNDTLNMLFDLRVLQILDVDEKKQTLKISSWVIHTWADVYMQWDPANFSGIESVVVPYKDLWKPDVVIYNSISGNYRIPMLDIVTVENSGTVYYTPPAIFETPCTMKIRYFPFDIQVCDLTFGTWEFTSDKLLMLPESADMKAADSYTDNTEWRFFNWSVINKLEEFSTFPDDSYSTLVYTLYLKRRPLYYLINIVLPCLILALLTLMVLSLPPESGERMSFGVSLLIALSVLNLMVAEIIPPSTDSVPMLVQFLIFNMVLVKSSVIISVLVLRLHHRQQYQLKMPSYVRALFMRILPKLLCVFPFEEPGHFFAPNKVEAVDVNELDVNGAVSQRNVNEAFVRITGQRKKPNGQTVDRRGRKPIPDDVNAKILGSIEDILEELKYLRQNINTKEKDEIMLARWRYVAVVVDRLAMVLAVLAYCVGAVVLYSDPELRFDL